MEEILAGRVFGLLTVVAEAPRRGHKNYYRYLVVDCECGTRGKEVSLSHLRQGLTSSCGCRKGTRSHGLSESRTYTSWESMKSRCNNTNNARYGNYGGRGIAYQDSWETFEGFLADMGERPDGFSLEREDVNGAYCKGNCIWLLDSEQSKNTTRTVRVTRDNRNCCLTDAAKLMSINPNTVVSRLRSGKTLEQALGPGWSFMTPVQTQINKEET